MPQTHARAPRGDVWPRGPFGQFWARAGSRQVGGIGQREEFSRVISGGKLCPGQLLTPSPHFPCVGNRPTRGIKSPWGGLATLGKGMLLALGLSETRLRLACSLGSRPWCVRRALRATSDHRCLRYWLRASCRGAVRLTPRSTDVARQAEGAAEGAAFGMGC